MSTVKIEYTGATGVITHGNRRLRTGERLELQSAEAEAILRRYRRVFVRVEPASSSTAADDVTKVLAAIAIKKEAQK